MKSKQVLIAVLAAAVLETAMAQAPAPTPPQDNAGEAVQPRFIWGILIQLAVSHMGRFAWNTFSQWLEARMMSGESALTDRLVLGSRGSPDVVIRPRAAPLELNARAADVVVGTPSAPLSTEGGKENYQGANIAVLAAAPSASTFAVRPVNQGFKTGERIKLRVISTFGGELSIENINPRGERTQIYPSNTAQVVVLTAGKETFIPLGADEYFEFIGATGREQLVVNLSDPRATGEHASRNKVYRQDVSYGSNFMQEVTAETYPYISQAIELQHSAP